MINRVQFLSLTAVAAVAMTSTANAAPKPLYIAAAASPSAVERHPDRATPDDWHDGRADEFDAMLTRTGALGSFVEGDVIVVIVPSSGSSTFSPSDAAELGVQVVVRTYDIELADIEAIIDMVGAVGWKPLRSGVYEPFAFFDLYRGVVHIYADAPVSQFQHVLDKFPGKVDYPGRAFGDYSRNSDWEPHWGGARLISPDVPGYPAPYPGYPGVLVGTCTSGFSVTTNATGKERMVTAGHCYHHGWDVNSPQGETFGTVVNWSQYPDYVDAELVGGAGIDMEGRIYIGGSSGLPADVIGAANPVTNYTYCLSGAVTHEACTLTLYDNQCYTVGQPPTPCSRMIHFVLPGTGACRGDSGAPIYDYVGDDVKIRGIFKGGDIDFATLAACEDPETGSEWGWMQIWSRIRDGYGVSIMTM